MFIIKKKFFDSGKGNEVSYNNFKEIILKQDSTSKEIFMSSSDRNENLIEVSFGKENIEITKYNYKSFFDSLIKDNPSHCILYEGNLIYFKTLKEFQEFLTLRFEILTPLENTCPICGKEKGQNLRFCFATGSGLPKEIFTCSKECLSELTHNIIYYKDLLK